MKDAGSGDSTSKEAFELRLPGRVLEFEAGFEIPSKFPFIISIDNLKQNFKQVVTCMFKCFITVNMQLTQSLCYKDYVATKLIGPQLHQKMSMSTDHYISYCCKWKKTCCPGYSILKVAKKVHK